MQTETCRRVMLHEHAHVHNSGDRTRDGRRGDSGRSHLIREAERTSADTADTSLTSLSDDFKDRLSLIWRRTHV